MILEICDDACLYSTEVLIRIQERNKRGWCKLQRVCGSYNSNTIGSGSLARTANVDLVVSPVLCVRAWGPSLIYAEFHQIC